MTRKWLWQSSRRHTKRQKPHRRCRIWAIAEAMLGLSHEREEIGQVAVVKRLGQLGQHEFAGFRDFGDDNAGAMPQSNSPTETTEAGQTCGWSCRGSLFVVAALAAQATVGVASGLFVFVEAFADIGFGVVLLNKGNNMFGVERDALAPGDATLSVVGPKNPTVGSEN